MASRIERTFSEYERGRAAFERRDFDLALTILEPLTREEPLFVPGLLLTARCLQLAGPEDISTEQARADLARAGDLLRQAVQVSHNDADALSDLAHFVDVIEDNPDAALQPATTALLNALHTVRDALKALTSCAEQMGRARVDEVRAKASGRLRIIASEMEELAELPEEA